MLNTESFDIRSVLLSKLLVTFLICPLYLKIVLRLLCCYMLGEIDQHTYGHLAEPSAHEYICASHVRLGIAHVCIAKEMHRIPAPVRQSDGQPCNNLQVTKMTPAVSVR